MTVGEVWRYLGPICVLAFPFAVLAADHGIPEGFWWDQAKDPAVWFLVVLAVGALTQGTMTLVRAPQAARETIRVDIQQLARRAFVPINKHMPEVPIDRLGVHVWTTDGKKLTRLVKYTMEQQRAKTPVEWRLGKGAIGIAWQRAAPLIADLTELYRDAARLDPAEFNALDPDVRYGLTADEVRRGGRYKSVLAYPLTAENNEVIGVLSVDCSVAGHSAELENLLQDRDFQDVLGACESALRRFVGQ